MADICCPNAVLSVWSLMCKQGRSHHLAHTGLWAPWGRSDACLGSTMQPPPGDENREAARRHEADQWLCPEGGNPGRPGARDGAPRWLRDLKVFKCPGSCGLLELRCFQKWECPTKERICPLLIVLMFVLMACMCPLKNSTKPNKGLQLILDLIFHRKLPPRPLDTYINAPLMDSHCKYCLFRK